MMEHGRDQPTHIGNFIAGCWEAEADTMPAINPATGEILAQLPKSTSISVDKAVVAARHVAPTWAKHPPFERARQCFALAEAVDNACEQLAQILSLEQGKVLDEARAEVRKAAEGFRLAAELVKQMGGQTLPTEDATKLAITIRQPRGVYGVITPWNFPLSIPVEYLAPGIATGNSIVWVPAPSTSLIACAFMDVLDKAGLPKGVVNLVIGEGAIVGDALVSHEGVSAIGFTGSAATGKHIAMRGAGKPLLLELGGNGPVIVFEDADLTAAAKAAAAGAFFNAGQICAATGRLLVHESVLDNLCEQLVEQAEAHILGDPLTQGTTMGPLNNEKVATKVKEHVDEAVQMGAKLLCGGKLRPDLGSPFYFEPTILSHVSKEMRINREETFGPVIPIVSFRNEAEVLALALESQYGLSVGIFTKDIDRAFRFANAIPSGIVNINDASSYWELHLPFGGASNTQSGIGRLGGMYMMEAMTELKMITITTNKGMIDKG